LLALYGFGFLARSVGIERCKTFVELRRPLLRTGFATLLVAAIVTFVESLESNKTSFDWSSYCRSGSAFAVNHASLLPVSVMVAVQLSAGFFAMKPRRLVLDPELPAWGVRPYVTFLETWCLFIVVTVGAVSALWLHTLAQDPSHTNVLLSFMGWGALGAVAALLVRIVRTAMSLRAECERLAFARDKSPDDPTEGLLGKSWWQVPSVFALAGGLAWWLLEQVGAEKLYSGGF
jgi:hypothetical protein